MQSVLDIIFRTVKQGTGAARAEQDLRNYGQTQQRVKSNAEKLDLAMTAVAKAVGIVGGAALLAKKAFDWAEEAAEIELVRARFDRLAAGMGANADELETEIGRATRGMLSNLEGVTLASELMSLGLVKNQEEAVRMTRVASALNMDMNQLVLTLSNMTTMRFDQINLQVDGFKERVQELEEAGLSASDAFRTAFLEQGENQIERLGDAADTSAGQFRQARAHWANFMDGLKMFALQVVQPVVEGFNAVSGAIEDLFDAVDDKSGELIDQVDTWAEYQDLLAELPLWQRMLINTTDGLSQANFEAAKAARENQGATEDLAGAQGELEAQTNETRNALMMTAVAAALKGGGIQDAWQKLIGLQDEAKMSALEYQTRIGHARQQVQELGSEDAWAELRRVQDEATDSAGDYAAKIGEARDNLREATQELIFQTMAEGIEDPQQILELGRALGQVSEEQYAIATASLAIKRANEEGLITWQQSVDMAADMADRLQDLEDPTLVPILLDNILAEAGLIEMGDLLDHLGLGADIDLDLEYGDTSRNLAAIRDLLFSIPTNRTVHVNTVHTSSGGGGGFPLGGVPYMFNQHGADFEVKGLPGRDQVPVNMMLTRGERVQVTPAGLTPKQNGGGMGSPLIGVAIFNNSFDLDQFGNQLRQRGVV